jgi:transposase-like protein
MAKYKYVQPKDRKKAALDDHAKRGYPSRAAKENGVSAHTMRVWLETGERRFTCETLRAFLEEE